MKLKKGFEMKKYFFHNITFCFMHRKVKKIVFPSTRFE